MAKLSVCWAIAFLFVDICAAWQVLIEQVPITITFFASLTPTFRSCDSLGGTSAVESASPGVECSLGTNADVMTVLAKLLSNQHVFFAGVSKEWRNACGDLPNLTRAKTADTSVSQLQWSFDGGLKKRPVVCMHIDEYCGVDTLKHTHSS